MQGIYPMAAITLLISVALWGGLMYVMAGRRLQYLWLLLPGLPLSAVVNLWVKNPVAIAVSQAAGIAPGFTLSQPIWFLVFAWMLAPVFEEAIKAFPLLVPVVRQVASDRLSALWTGMALGLSFGLGEAGYLAYAIGRSPAYSTLPWYLFTGYLGERIIVCLAHGLMTALFVYGLHLGAWKGFMGYLVAMGFHALLNAGAVLFQLGMLPAWATQLTLVATLIPLAALFERLRSRAMRSSAEARQEADEIIYYRQGGI